MDYSAIMKQRRKNWTLAGIAIFAAVVVYLQPKVPQLSVMEEPISAPNALVDEGNEASAPFPSHDIVGLFLDLCDKQPVPEPAQASQQKLWRWIVGLFQEVPTKYKCRDLTTQDLERYVAMRKTLDAHPYLRQFHGYRLSLDTIDFVRYRGEVLVKSPYLEPGMSGKTFIARLNGMEEEGVEGDATMRSLLYNPAMNKLVILYQPPKGFDQARFIWAIREVLSLRTFSWVDRVFLLTDPAPTPGNDDWYLFGWPSGRQQIQDGLPKESTNYTVPGLVLSFVVLYVSTGSLAFAGWGVALLFLMLMGVRSSIALLAHFFVIAERPYIVLAYSNTLIQGQSLLLFASYIMREEKREERWTMRLVMASLVAANLTNLFSVWWWFGVRPIEEMAVESMVGTILALVAAYWVMPVLVGRLPAKDIRRDWQMPRTIQSLVERMVGRNSQRLGWALLIASVILGPLAYYNLAIGSNPVDYFRRTRAHEGFERLQRSGLGADGIYARFGCKAGSNNFLDPECLAAAMRLAAILEADPTNVKVGSVLPSIERLSRGEYGTPVPPTPAYARYVWEDIDDAEVPAGIRDNLYTADLRYLHVVVMQKETGTSETTATTMRVIAKAAAGVPELEVKRGGPSALFAETDRLIHEGEAKVILSQIATNWFWYLVIAWLVIKRQQHTSEIRLSALRLSLVASMPFIFATGAAVCVMYLAGIPFDLASAAILAMANMASNDVTLYYVTGWIVRVMQTQSVKTAHTTTLADKGEQVAEDCGMNSGTFLFLCLSSYGPIRVIGWLIPTMLCFCGLGVFKIMLPMLPWTIKKKRPPLRIAPAWEL